MSYHRIDPDDDGLPDIEVWSDYPATFDCRRCGVLTGPEAVVNDTDDGVRCTECGRKAKLKSIDYEQQWYGWVRIPGCDPDTDLMGPFPSENQAVEEIRKLANSID